MVEERNYCSYEGELSQRHPEGLDQPANQTESYEKKEEKREERATKSSSQEGKRPIKAHTAKMAWLHREE